MHKAQCRRLLVMAVISFVAMYALMYENKRLNVGIIVVSVIALAGFWVMIRQQTAISDGNSSDP